MNPTIDKATTEVRQMIAALEDLNEAPSTTRRSLRMAIAHLHDALEALDAAKTS